MSTVTLENTVGQIVKENPAAAQAFQRFGIDFCCGGKKTLGEVVASKSLDLEEVLQALRDSVDRTSEAARTLDCSSMGISQLVDHIVSTHHAYLNDELPRLAEMVEKVSRAHGEAHPKMLDLLGTYRAFADELRQHAQKEESILFPALRELELSKGPAAFPFGSVRNPIHAMEHEHDSAGEALKRMRELTNDFIAPPDACNTWLGMLEGLRDLEEDLHWHVHKENNVLFPKAIEVEAALNST